MKKAERQDAQPAPTRSEIRGLARELVGRFGERATCVANFEALKARQLGDGIAMSLWRWVAGATVEILRSEPVEGERDHGEGIAGGARRSAV